MYNFSQNSYIIVHSQGSALHGYRVNRVDLNIINKFVSINVTVYDLY